MSENPFFIPGLPANTPAVAPHNEQGALATRGGPRPHNEQGGRTPTRESDRFEPSPRSAAPDSPSPGSTHPLRVHPITTLCVAALLAALLVQAAVSTHPGAMSTAFAFFAAVVVGSFALALVPFLILRRSNRALNLAMCAQMLLGIAGAGLTTWRHTQEAEDRKALGHADAALTGLSGSMRRQLQHGDVARVDPAAIDRAAGTLAQAADQLDGDNAAVLRAAASLMTAFSQRNEVFDAINDELESLGGLDPSTMSSRRDVQNRLALIDQFLTLNRQFEDELKSAPRRFRDSLVSAGLDHRQVARAESDFAAGFRLPTQLQFRRLQAQFGESAKNYLGVLADEWGRWKFSTDVGQVVFENDAVIERFNLASDALQGSMLAMAGLQREALDMNVIAEVSTDGE